MENLLFNATVSDLKHNPRGNHEVLLKDADVDKIIDSYEQKMGIKRPSTKPPTFVFKTILLEPDKEHDRQLLNDLLNKREKYNIIKWSENWTRTGLFRVFVIYQEFEAPPTGDKKNEQAS